MHVFLAIFLAQAAPPSPAAPPASPRAPVGEHGALFTLDRTKDGCAAVLRPLPAGPPRTLWTAKACADHVLLDVANRRAIVAKDRGVRGRGFDGSVVELGALPAAPVELWLEESGALRATVLEPVPEGAPFPADVALDDALPPWGTPALASLYELDAATVAGTRKTRPRWRRLEVKPTKTEAGDTPGVTVLEAPHAPRKGVLSRAARAAAMACPKPGGSDTPLVCDDEAPARKKLVGAGDDETAGTLAVGGDGARVLVFRVMQGDTLHAFPPVLACPAARAGDVACPKPVVLEERAAGDAMGGRQLGIAAAGPWLLLADEYTGDAPRVVELATGKELLKLPASTSAVLLPPEQARALAR